MDLTFRFFATFRQAVGQKTLERSYEGDQTVGTVLRDLVEEYPDLEVFDADGDVREYLSILKNGKDIAFQEGLETPLEDGDTLSIFPPVAGGSLRPPWR